MKVYIGTDHAGYELKEKLKNYLNELGYTTYDNGAFQYNETDDYPDFIIPTAQAVANNPDSRGIVIGGSGQGEAMAANKIPGVRATEYYGGSLDIVRISREHNDANVLSLGARFATEQEAKDAVRVFLETKFSSDDRHVQRIKKLEPEKKLMKKVYESLIFFNILFYFPILAILVLKLIINLRRGQEMCCMTEPTSPIIFILPIIFNIGIIIYLFHILKKRNWIDIIIFLILLPVFILIATLIH